MTDRPLLSKKDALLKKHRGSAATTGKEPNIPPPEASPPEATPPDTWLPVLTQIIERGQAPDVSAPVSTGQTLTEASPAPEVTDTLAEQLMSELAPRLSEVMEKQVAAELRKNIDQTVANLLSQLDVNVREIVREAIDEKLRQQPGPRER